MRTLYLATLTAAAALIGAPAFAQSTLDELTVTGQYNPRNGSPETLSERVSYADLDLTLAADRAELNGRVQRAAADVCKQVGAEPTGFQNLSSSCEKVAVNGAMSQVRTAIAQARSQAYAQAAYPGSGYAADASATEDLVSNGPVPDTARNRARYGAPQSLSGRRTTPAGD